MLAGSAGLSEFQCVGVVCVCVCVCVRAPGVACLQAVAKKCAPLRFLIFIA